MKAIKTTLALGAALAMGVSTAEAASLFEDDLNADSSANYTVLTFAGARDGAVFAFDYSTLGIPEAPNSGGGGTTGLQLFANNPNGGVAGSSGVQVVPTIAGLGSSYTMTFDIWMNYNGTAPAGGTGSTEAFGAGAGFSAAAAINAGVIDGSYFTVTGDGGSSNDIRSFTNGGYQEAGVNQGQLNNSADAYYTGIFPGGVDIATFGQGGSQTGTTVAGQMAFEWHEVELVVDGTTVSFSIDGLLIAQDTTADVTGDLLIAYFDYFSSESDAPQFSFGLVDNLVVTPEPASLALLGLGGLMMIRRRRN